MTFNAQLIGKRYPEVRFDVTPEVVRDFCESIADEAPVFASPEAAHAAGFPDQLAPPTILAQLQIVAVQEITSDPEIGAAFDGIVHGEQAYEWTRQVKVGDLLRTEPVIEDIRSKGAVAFMDVVLDVTDADGEHVVRSKSTLVHLGGEA